MSNPMIFSNELGQGFLLSQQDGYAVYQLKGTEDNAVLRFASMDLLNRFAQKTQSKVNHAMERKKNTRFSSKAEAEAFWRGEGFTVKQSDAPDSFRVQSNVGVTAAVHLRFEHGGCFMTDCEIEQLVRKENYALVYTAPLSGEYWQAKPPDAICEFLFTKFNMDCPEDFSGHSLSVSDVIVLRQNGHMDAYYTDSIGFCHLPDFLSPETRTLEKAKDNPPQCQRPKIKKKEMER